MNVVPDDPVPGYEYFEEYSIGDHRILGVFRGKDGIYGGFLNNKWIHNPELAAYVFKGEQGSSPITVDRAKEIMKSMGGNPRKVKGSGRTIGLTHKAPSARRDTEGHR